MRHQALAHLGIAVPMPTQSELEVFIKVACDDQPDNLVKITELFVSVDPECSLASYSFTCDSGNVHWGEISRETGGLLVGLGARTRPELGDQLEAEGVVVSAG